MSARAGAVAVALATAGLAGLAATALAYPTDQLERTGIRRLGWQHAIDAGTRPGRKLPPAAQWPAERIRLEMLSAPDFRLGAETPRDPALQAGLEAILRQPLFRHYGVALLDITDPTHPRYAAVRENEPLTPGSVAKILVGAALLRALADRFPDDIAAREAFLRDVKVTADDWALPNVHEVPVVDGESVVLRPVRAGDTFSLWEWLDHMLSPSSNAAASMVWREAALMKLLGAEYPPKSYGPDLWRRWDKATVSQAAFDAIDAPLVAAGLDPEVLKLRLFFTTGAGKHIDSGPSLATPLGLLQWMVAVEQGRMVDAFSSLELKRMLYLTRRRVRYVQAPELRDSAVFFKSGSLWQCKPEPGYTCTAYEGNAVNVLNALVEVETPPPAPATPGTANGAAVASGPAAPPVTPAPPPPSDAAVPALAGTVDTAGRAEKPGQPPASGSPPSPAPAPAGASATPAGPPERIYIIAVMSNELKRNSADDHVKLAGYVHRLVQR